MKNGSAFGVMVVITVWCIGVGILNIPPDFNRVTMFFVSCLLGGITGLLLKSPK